MGIGYQLGKILVKTMIGFIDQEEMMEYSYFVFSKVEAHYHHTRA